MKFKKILYIGFLSFAFNLVAMEQQPQPDALQFQEEQKRKLFIRIVNMTEDSIRVVCKYIHEREEFPLRLEPGQKIDIADFLKIERLYIVKYGRWVQYSNSSYFTFGWVGPYNVMQEEIIKELILSEESAEVTIESSGKEIAASLTSNEKFQWLAAFVAPYSYKCKMADRRTETKNEFFLFDFFPRVKRAFRADQPIHERYFLDLPEYADEYAIQKAYERVRNFWICEQEKTQDPAKIKLTRDALKFIEAAYKSLMDKKTHSSEFKTLVYEEDRFPTTYFFEEEFAAANAQLPNNNN